MCVNDIYTVEISGMTDDGRGVGRAEGVAVFVPYALVGERVRIIIEVLKKNYAEARLLSVEEPSPHRTKSECPYFYECGGCAYWHTDYEFELEIKQRCVEDCIRRIGGIDCEVLPIIGCPSDRRYRNKASYKAEGGEVGFFAGRTHRLVPVSDCLLQTEQTNLAVNCIGDFLKESGSSGSTGSIFIRTLGDKVVAGIDSDIQAAKADELADRLRGVGVNLAGLLINGKLGYGNDRLTDKIGETEYSVSANSFYQVNIFQTKTLYDKVREFAALSGRENVWDLYCGTGTIGLYLASGAKRIVGVESIPSAVEDARENARRNGIDNAEYFCASAEAAAPKIRTKPDVVILDPPRRGCDKRLLETVAKSGAERVVYVSCKPSTLARDMKRLEQLGYTTLKACPVDMFPRTSHVETVVLLSKLKSKEHIYVDINLDELDLTKAEKKATYQEIKDYVLEHSGLKVSQLNIAQVKRKYGIIERENYNKPKSKNTKQPQCPPEKEKAIKEALGHFGMI